MRTVVGVGIERLVLLVRKEGFVRVEGLQLQKPVVGRSVAPDELLAQAEETARGVEDDNLRAALEALAFNVFSRRTTATD